MKKFWLLKAALAFSLLVTGCTAGHKQAHDEDSKDSKQSTNSEPKQNGNGSKQASKSTKKISMSGDRSAKGIVVKARRDGDDRVWVPLKDAAKVFGFRSHWDAKKKTAELGYTDPIFKLSANKSEAWAGGPVTLRNPPLKVEDKQPMVSIDTLAELLDASVVWSADGSRVRLDLPRDELSPPTFGMAQTAGTVKVSGSASFRTQPSVSSKVIRYLKIGEPVTLLSKTNKYWYSIRDAKGVTGYVSSRYIPDTGSGAPAQPAVPTAPTQQPGAATQAGGTTSQKLIAFAETFNGTKYKFGSGPYEQTKTFDCSSYVQHVFKQFQIKLPRSSRQQSQVGQSVARSALKPGDIVFFYTPGRFSSNKIVGHVAIYKGNGQIIHTYGSPGVVTSDLNSKSWSNRYLFAKRVLP